MTLSRPIVFGNWKMNGLRADGVALAGAVADRAVRVTGTVGIFPPSTLLHAVARRVEGTVLIVGGQDCHDAASGAFTGSVSAAMLADAGATAVILGHSERRHGLGETDEVIRKKAEAAMRAGLLVVLCIGETEAEMLAGSRDQRLRAQLEGSLPVKLDRSGLVIAYEPVWAIGTGRTPTNDEIRSTHTFIRATLAALRPEGRDLPILYGGSVKPSNAADILALEAVDGALVGGASLDVQSFWGIYTAGGGA